MPWERGDGAGASAAPTAPAAVSAPVAAAAPPPPPTASGVISEEVAKWVADGKKWSKSAIAAEQARRGRKGLPALTDAEVTVLLGEPAAPATAASTPAPAAKPAATPTARPVAAAASAASRSEEDTSELQSHSDLVCILLV